MAYDSSSKLEKDIKNQVIEQFLFNNTDFQRDVVVGNSSSDFYVKTPSGGTAIFEIKLWESSKENIDRAKRLASLITSTSGVDITYVVFPHLPANLIDQNIIQPSDIFAILNQSQKSKKYKKPPSIKQKPKKTVFAAMPFDPKYDDTYIVAMQPAAHRSNLECIRVDEEPKTGDIVINIKYLIENSILVIADVSELKPNVLYEMGYAEGLNRQVIQICSTPLKELPFDIRNNKTIPYLIGQTSKLIPELSKMIKNALHAQSPREDIVGW